MLLGARVSCGDHGNADSFWNSSVHDVNEPPIAEMNSIAPSGRGLYHRISDGIPVISHLDKLLPNTQLHDEYAFTARKMPLRSPLDGTARLCVSGY